MQMLPLTVATRFENRGPQCLLALVRSLSALPSDQFALRVYYLPQAEDVLLPAFDYRSCVCG